MKKINFFLTRSLQALCLLIGLLFFASVDMKAQAITPGYVYSQEITQNRIPALQTLQSNYSATSAKWQVVQDAIDYYNSVLADLSSPNPNISTAALADTDIFNHDLVRRASEYTVLYPYSAAELAVFQTMLNGELAAGNTAANSDIVKKLEWTLFANSY